MHSKDLSSIFLIFFNFYLKFLGVEKFQVLKMKSKKLLTQISKKLNMFKLNYFGLEVTTNSEWDFFRNGGSTMKI